MRYPFVIFDIDGTLVDTEEATRRTAQTVYRRLTGKEEPVHGWPDVFAMSSRDAAQQMGLADPELFEREVIKLYTQVAPTETNLFPGVMDVLEKLRAMGCKFGVCTARIHEEMAYDFERLGLDTFEWTSACADECVRPKPDPAAIEQLLQRAHIEDVSQALYLGDLLVDYACANGANVAFAQAAWKNEAPIKGAAYVFHDPQEIVRGVAGD